MKPAWFSRLSPPPAQAPVRLDELPWPAIAQLQAAREDVLLLPLGATEQHGPHLPVNTDSVIARSVCEYASAKTGAPLLPAIPFTVSIGHTEKWPGTFSIFHETLIATIREIARWAVATGWKRLLIVNAHFGNDAALRVAVDRVRFDFANRLFVGLRNTYALTPAIWNYFISDADDLHANRAETDLMRFLAPELVRMDAVEDDPDRTGDLIFNHLVAFTSTNGVTGRPSEGTAERGATLFREMGDALAALIEKARGENHPLAWSRTSSAFL